MTAKPMPLPRGSSNDVGPAYHETPVDRISSAKNMFGAMEVLSWSAVFD